MTNIAFGNWLTDLRQKAGLSQFQLGILLGVTDKAVSKWETGQAVPRIKTCEKMAMIYHMSLDELMSGGNPEEPKVEAEIEQRMIETLMWQEARNRLSDVYGRKLPPLVLSRFKAEEELFRDTGLIEHLILVGKLHRKGVQYDWYCDQLSSTLLAWLCGASLFNPLPAHSVCPACHKTVFHPEAHSGWDLPEANCACGTRLIRYGHNISLSYLQSKRLPLEKELHIGICRENEEVVRELICQQYGQRWKAVEYRAIWKTARMLKDIFKIPDDDRNLLIIPQHTELAYMQIDGVYQINRALGEDNAFTESGVYPFTIALRAHDQVLGIWQTDVKPQELLSPDGRMTFRSKDVRKSERLCFSELVQRYALSFCTNEGVSKLVDRLVQKEGIPLTDIPLTKEDLHVMISSLQDDAGINNHTLADIVLDQIHQEDGWFMPDEDMCHVLSEINAPAWLAELIKALTGLPSKAEAVQSAYQALIKMH